MTRVATFTASSCAQLKSAREDLPDGQAETHIFPKGGHGFGVGRASDGTNQWVQLFVNWVKNSQF